MIKETTWYEISCRGSMGGLVFGFLTKNVSICDIFKMK